jgi:uncharacterized protein (DUF1501 family)
MHINRLPDLNRRAFLKRLSALGVMGAAAPMALNLAAAGEAAAFDASDYKAIVCVFLYGGNDHYNTFVPYDLNNYGLYSGIRTSIALDRSTLGATALTPAGGQTLTDNLQYALAPQLTGLASLFQSGQLAIQLNVGPLIVPLTLAQYQGQDRVNYPLPPKLFSHNDQQSEWQSDGSEGTAVGWGGRLGDMALSGNGNSLLTCISAAGNAVFVSGNTALQYQISTGGAIKITAANASNYYGSTAVPAALKTLITQSSGNIMENEFAKVTKRSIDLEGTVNSALSGVTLATNFDTDGKKNSLADQLKIVARLIGARNAFGVKRQVFFVSLGGFDLHDNLIAQQPGLLTNVNEAMTAFYNATVELGVQNKVTTFTASDFGRTLASNGDGSDHGWGSHHFIMGGAVNGGRYYGTAPHVSLTSSDQVGQGRLLPSTATDQMSATLAKWFGVSASEMPSILPNIGHFATQDMGYL